MRMLRSLTLVLGFLFSLSALSKPQLNSLCYLEDKSKAEVEGANAQRRYELASVSKIVTSFWALDSLGPNFRFKTKLYITSLGGGSYDIHVAGARDPFFGREMTYFLISELARLNIRNIRELTFDENLIFYWSVRERPSVSILPNPDRIENELRQRLRFDSRQYTAARRNAQSLGFSLEAAPTVKISRVRFVSKQEFQPDLSARIFELRSTPLHSYLKEMNRLSNNYVADRLFDSLGGINTFQTFAKNRLGMDLNDIRFVNGSGDKYYSQNSNGDQIKIYNEASCDALVTILDKTRDLLKKFNMDLEDIMAVSGMDGRSTLKGRYSNSTMSGAMVAKTGTIDPAVTLAGMISTDKGDVYFGIFYHTNGPGDWNRGRDAIRNQVVTLMNRFGGKDTIRGYHNASFLPFDSSSRLNEVLEVKQTEMNTASLRNTIP